MSSFGSIMSIARSAIFAHQTAVQVTSQNISNAQTEGYSGQRAELMAGVPVRGVAGSLGSGVLVRDIARVRDSHLDASFRRESANAGEFGLRRDLMGEVEEIFGNLADPGLASTLDAFWSSWSDLANHPSNGSLRSLVQQHGDQVAFSLRNISQRLDEVERSTSFRLESTLKQLNGLSAEVADLNRQVALAESGGQSAPDLRDARDRAIDVMSAITPVRVIERSDGTVGVLISSATVVDGWDAKELVVQSGPPLGIGVAGRSQALPETGGTPGAMLGVVNDELPGIRAQLNTFASALVGSVNTLHREGWSDVDFFDPAGV